MPLLSSEGIHIQTQTLSPHLLAFSLLPCLRALQYGIPPCLPQTGSLADLLSLESFFFSFKLKATSLGISKLASENPRCPVKFEFQKNNNR